MNPKNFLLCRWRYIFSSNMQYTQFDCFVFIDIWTWFDLHDLIFFQCLSNSFAAAHYTLHTNLQVTLTTQGDVSYMLVCMLHLSNEMRSQVHIFIFFFVLVSIHLKVLRFCCCIDGMTPAYCRIVLLNELCVCVCCKIVAKSGWGILRVQNLCWDT